jgi:hypothetical protein
MNKREFIALLGGVADCGAGATADDAGYRVPAQKSSARLFDAIQVI